MSKFLFLSIALVLISCASKPITPRITNVEQTAKIRVNQAAATWLHPGKTCFSYFNSETVLVTYPLFANLSTSPKNKSLGMPIADDTPRVYSEFLISSGEPITIRMDYTEQVAGGWLQCGPVGITFTPEIDKNYDTKFIRPGGGCSIEIREIVVNSLGKSHTIPVEAKPAFECR